MESHKSMYRLQHRVAVQIIWQKLCGPFTAESRYFSYHLYKKVAILRVVFSRESAILHIGIAQRRVATKYIELQYFMSAADSIKTRPPTNLLVH